MTPRRTEPFVPLTASPPVSSGPDEPVAAASPQAGNARPFLPLEPKPGPASSPRLATAAEPGCEPRVSLQRDGDRVTGIQIRCTCGQMIDLACVYQEPNP